MSARTVLARHPIAVECSRTASELSGLEAEVVVFESERAFIVASTNVAKVMAPRQTTDAEEQLLSGTRDIVVGERSTAFSFTNHGETVGSITLHGVAEDITHSVIQSCSRMLTGLLADQLVAGDAPFEVSVLEGLRDPVIVLTPEMKIRWTNKAIGSLLGRTPAEMIGKSAVEFLHPDDIESTLEGVVGMQQGRAMSRVFVRLSKGDGDYQRIEITGADHSDNSVIGGLVLSLRSADRESEFERSIDRSEAMGSAIVSGLHDAIVATDEFGDIITVNRTARDMFGLGTTPIQDISLENLELFDGSGRKRPLDRDPSITEQAGTGQANTGDLCVITGPDELKYISLDRSPVSNSKGDLIGSVLVFHDLTAERMAEAELRSQALHDQLTGLANRRQLEQRMAELASASVPVQVAAIFVDLDGFKLVNDTHGHRIGDHLIRIAAKRLQATLRAEDLLVRQGGDEFVVIQAGVPTIDVARQSGERLRAVLAEPYEINELRFDVTASIGVAMAMSDELNEETLLQQADIALYAAKADGRDRVEIFNDHLAAAVSLEERQRRILRSALESDRLEMHFQPLVETATGHVHGYEALARVRTEEGELLGPGSFMDAVTSTGLMWDLDRAAFDLSCQAAAVLAELEPDQPPTVACNFSSFSLAQPGFVAYAQATVTKHSVNTSQIWIEITESAAFDGGAQSLQALNALNEAGFRLALDDFGTGYSSLAHLRDLPISSVKVDRSFVSKLSDGRSERVIAEAVVSLAQDLGLNVVAEGVETSEHLDNVRQLGFGTVQGWHYAPAMSLTDAIAARQRTAPTTS